MNHESLIKLFEQAMNECRDHGRSYIAFKKDSAGTPTATLVTVQDIEITEQAKTSCSNCINEIEKIETDDENYERHLTVLDMRLEKFDYYYYMSDDHREWSSGHKELEEIRKQLRMIDEGDAVELWNKHCPADLKIKSVDDITLF